MLRLTILALGRLGLQKSCDGIQLFCLGANDEGKILLKIQQSIAIINSFDKLNYKRVCKSLTRICTVKMFGTTGRFIPNSICVLDENFVLSSSPIVIASLIVHETTHAILWKRGFRFSEDQRSRIEKVCVRRQLSFAHNLPDPGCLTDDLQAQLALEDSVWSKETAREIKRAAEVSAAASGDLAKWEFFIIRAFRRFRTFGRRPLG